MNAWVMWTLATKGWLHQEHLVKSWCHSQYLPAGSQRNSDWIVLNYWQCYSYYCCYWQCRHIHSWYSIAEALSFNAHTWWCFQFWCRMIFSEALSFIWVAFQSPPSPLPINFYLSFQSPCSHCLWRTSSSCGPSCSCCWWWDSHYSGTDVACRAPPDWPRGWKKCALRAFWWRLCEMKTLPFIYN